MSSRFYEKFVPDTVDNKPVKELVKKLLEDEDAESPVFTGARQKLGFCVPVKNFYYIQNYIDKYSFDSKNIFKDIKKLGKKTFEHVFYEIEEDKLKELVNNPDILFIKKIKEDSVIKFDNHEKKTENLLDFLGNLFDCKKGINSLDKIYIINLKHRSDRLESITKELNKIGTNKYLISRINAVYFKDFGALGCGLSHRMALQNAIKNNYERILIFEDDFIFKFDTYTTMKALINILENRDSDVVMLSANLEEIIDKSGALLNFTEILAMNKQNTEIELTKVVKARTASAYCINNKESISMMNDNFKEACELMKEHYESKPAQFVKFNYAIDMYWQPLQKKLKWFTAFPTIGLQIGGYSDIENKDVFYGC